MRSLINNSNNNAGDGVPLRVPSMTKLHPLTLSARQDLTDGLFKVELWGRLGWLDVKRRYRRTTIGPFWNTITLGMYIVSVGLVGAGLSRQDLTDYLPYLISGMVVWMLLSTMINEGCAMLIVGQGLFRNVRFEYSILAFALVWRNFLIFLHNVLVYLLIILIWKPSVLGLTTLLAVPGLVFVLANGAWISLLCGMLCLRYRDVQPLVATMVQISMLITPLFWPAESLSGMNRLVFVEANPLYHLLDIVRAPFLGNLPSLTSYASVTLVTCAGWALTYFVFQRFRRRLAYWG